MDQTHIPYSFKNIPTPSKHQYELALLNKIESFISNMRWKAYFFLKGEPRADTQCSKEYYGFKTNAHPPRIKELDNFEMDLIGLVKSIKYRKINNSIQQQMRNDFKKIQNTNKIFVKADKSNNLYKMSPNKYNKMLHSEVNKFYKKAPPNLEAEINKEAELLAGKLKIENRVEKFNLKKCFITVKDHKENFHSKPTCRLINPAKTQMGRISKVILQDICSTLRIALNVNQWRNTNDCIKWFNDYEKNDKCSFIKYDIKEFYPSITEKVFEEALSLAREYMFIPEDKIMIIRHCRKSLLYYNEDVWIKKGTSGNFDNPMGSYDGAEVCEIIGCLLLHNLNSIIDPLNHGLYRDDGLIIMDNCTPRGADIVRKKLHWLFNKFGFKLDIQANLKITDYLDIKLNLLNGSISPFRKNNQHPCYIDTGSNHPKQTFNHIPNSIAIRLSNNSSNMDIFNQNKHDYERALKNSGYKTKLIYKNSNEASNTNKKNRSRKVLWFTPPYNMAVASKIGKNFFKILKKNFPPSNILYKIFNRNTVKLSYSCMSNVASLISGINSKKLKKKQIAETPKCNCVDRNKCPLAGRCQYECVVYKVEVHSQKPCDKRVYIGSTQGPFKKRYYNHKSSFTHERYRHSTSLSNYIWDVKKKQDIDPILKWEIIKKCHKYRAGNKYCLLCMEEKLAIASYDNSRELLNQRSEVLNTCRHRREYLLGR